MSITDTWFNEKEINILWELVDRKVRRWVQREGDTLERYKILKTIQSKLRDPFLYCRYKIHLKGRDAIIYDKRLLGYSYQKLAHQYSVTPQRIMQICHKQERIREKVMRQESEEKI